MIDALFSFALNIPALSNAKRSPPNVILSRTHLCSYSLLCLVPVDALSLIMKCSLNANRMPRKDYIKMKSKMFTLSMNSIVLRAAPDYLHW